MQRGRESKSRGRRKGEILGISFPLECPWKHGASSYQCGISLQIHELEIELEALKRGKSEQEIEQERQIQTEIEEKIAALNESQGQLQKEVDVLTKEVKELEKASKRDNLKEKNEELSLSLMKLGTVLESMESQLKEKLALAKVKSDDHNSELKRVRQDLSVAKMAITAVQSKIIQCQQQQKKVNA